MKRYLTLLTIVLSLVLINHSCKPDPEEEIIELGSIYGIVTDKATGEPVKSANVQLRPSGETSLTGNDGRYEFLDLKNGNYSITVSKTGYTDLIDDYIITVDGSKSIRRDVQIEVLPAELRIIDNNGNDIDELDFVCTMMYPECLIFLTIVHQYWNMKCLKQRHGLQVSAVPKEQFNLVRQNL